MSSAKERHYWSQLRAALTAGQWLAQFPAKTPQGAPLSWSELFRKFNKHCKGFNDVSELASQNYGLALLLATHALNEDEDYGDVRDFSLELGHECILPSERVEEATAGYEAVKALQSANSDSVNFTLAYYAYALDRPSDCLQHLAQIPDFSQIQQFIPGTSRSTTSTLLTIPGASRAPSASSSVTGFSSFIDSSAAEIQDGRAWALTETFRSLCLQGMSHERIEPQSPTKALRAYHAAIPAFRVLQSADFASLISTPARLPSGKLDYTPFIQLRELWRWVERLLWRAICLSSRTSNAQSSEDDTDEEHSLWMWLEKYTVCSASWPPNFRTEHRSTISSIYLRALVLRHGIPKGQQASPEKPLWMQTARSVVQDYRAILNVSTSFPKAGERNVKVEEFVDVCVSVWEASGAVGEHAGWVLDVLWWATRLTFNSSRVLRHMIRLLYLSGDPNLAKRSLRLYVQVVSKAWIASKQGAGESVDPEENDSATNAEHEGYLEDTDTDVHWVETLVFGARMLCKVASASSSFTAGPHDLEDVKEAKSLMGKAKERMKFVETSDPETETFCRRLKAEVALAEGIADSILALKGQDRHTRPGLLESAHSYLLDSISIYPTPAAHFHLALSYARDSPHQDLNQGIQHAGSAVEGCSRDLRYWHLLGLLLTAVEKWHEAETILAHGAELDLFSGSEALVDEPSELDAKPDEGITRPEQVSGGAGDAETTTITLDGNAQGSIRARRRTRGESFALSISFSGSGHGDDVVAGGLTRTFTSETITPRTAHADHIDHIGALNASVVPRDATFVPPSGDLLRNILDEVTPSKQELFEWGLELRMTQMALVEVRQGPEGAEEGWLEVFSWVAEKKGLGPPSSGGPSDQTQGLGNGNGRRSLDVSTGNVSSISVNALAEVRATESRRAQGGIRHGGEVQEPSVSSSASTEGAEPAPPPITISLATPDGESVPRAVDDRRSIRSYAGSEKRSIGQGHPSQGQGRSRRSASLERTEKDKDKDGLIDKSKKVQQMLKSRVQKGHMRISAVGRKIGHGVTRPGSLRRSNSTPDFHAVLQQTSYQASSIHSRRRISSVMHSEAGSPRESPTPPPAPSPVPQSANSVTVANSRFVRENRLISDLWLMSAATFRRLSKIDQAKGAIQEGEARDEGNPNVWVQLALYYSALGHHQHAISTLQKALFIDPDNVPATVHLTRLYLTPRLDSTSSAGYTTSSSSATTEDNIAGQSGSAAADKDDLKAGEETVDRSKPAQSDVDLACGLLTQSSKGRGWDVPEVWYYLATAYRLQGRAERESEALGTALRLAEGRGIREIGAAIGLCI
ncbi:hypothetical protein D9611_008907 [Ephemerocybe angulata]|uniref:TPR-like protein n=1 Tax=Ephemerocybe angulata TaxID=980116 RepID=A0A8H5FCJ7_9AGAR|nr:hypothetical protein D9611_008907 [Tulosesus angulatus]